MQIQRSFLMVVASLSAITAAVSGCATNRVSLVDEGIVSVETVSSDKVRLLWTDVYDDGKDLVVRGVVKRRSYTSYPLKTHVDVAVLSPDGTILQQARSADIYVPSHRPGKTVNWKRFEVRFPEIPQDSKVRMVVHSGRHDEAT